MSIGNQVAVNKLVLAIHARSRSCSRLAIIFFVVHNSFGDDDRAFREESFRTNGRDSHGDSASIHVHGRCHRRAGRVAAETVCQDAGNVIGTGSATKHVGVGVELAHIIVPGAHSAVAWNDLVRTVR